MSQLTSQLAALSEVADEIEAATEAVADEMQTLIQMEVTLSGDLEYAIDVLTKQTMALRFMVAEVRHQQDTDDTVRTFIRNHNAERLNNIPARVVPTLERTGRVDVGSDFD